MPTAPAYCDRRSAEHLDHEVGEAVNHLLAVSAKSGAVLTMPSTFDHALHARSSDPRTSACEAASMTSPVGRRRGVAPGAISRSAFRACRRPNVPSARLGTASRHEQQIADLQCRGRSCRPTRTTARKGAGASSSVVFPASADLLLGDQDISDDEAANTIAPPKAKINDGHLAEASQIQRQRPAVMPKRRPRPRASPDQARADGRWQQAEPELANAEHRVIRSPVALAGSPQPEPR